METRPPTAGRILIAVGFAISCFGLLLFLWLAFGGPVPLKPEGYRVTVPFDEATQLAQEADVRISGVPVGKVKRVDLGDQGLAEATIEIESEYAPIPADTRATLRQKTLLGETYVELSPGSESAPKLTEGGELDFAQVSESVQLDEIFRTFDERTRNAFRGWMQGQAAALEGRGADLSAALASLEPFAAEAERTLRVLDSDAQAVRGLVSSGGEVFEALSERRGQLSGLIRNSREVFETTARRNAQLAAAFQIFPTFLRESRETLLRIDEFARETDPLVLQLRPAARELSPTLTDLGALAPDLERFLRGFGETADAGKRGLPALQRLVSSDLRPLLTRIDPYFAELNSLLEVIGLYRREIAAFLANVAAATNGTLNEADIVFRHLRTAGVFAPQALAAYPERLLTNRTSAYLRPGGYEELVATLGQFETRQCAGGAQALLDPGDAGAFPADLFDRLQTFAFGTGVLDSDDIDAPPCKQQGDFESVGVTPETTQYLHVRRQP
jgi:virulence factor Mce-like protein